MIALKPIVRANASTIRLTIVDTEDASLKDITGWTAKIRIGRSRGELGGIYELEEVAPVGTVDGVLLMTIPASITETIVQGSVIIDLQLKSTDAFKQVFIGRARVMNEQEYLDSYIQESQHNGIDQQLDDLVGETDIAITVADDPVNDITVNLDWNEIADVNVRVIHVPENVTELEVGNPEDAFTYFVVNNDLETVTFWLVDDAQPGLMMHVRNNGYGVVQVQARNDGVINTPGTLVLRGNGSLVSLLALRPADESQGLVSMWDLSGDVASL